MLIIVTNIYIVLRTLTPIDESRGFNYSTLHVGYETERMETRAEQCIGAISVIG